MRKFFILLGIILLFLTISVYYQKNTKTHLIAPIEHITNQVPVEQVIENESKETVIEANPEKIQTPENSIEKKNVTPSALKIPNHTIPFFTHAPTGEWSDPRQQDGCEEASAIMAMAWVQGKSFSNQEALQEIITLANFEQKKYGEHRDISLQDIKAWIFKDYFNYSKVEVVMNVNKNDIINALEEGKLVLLPLNGQKLNNPYFTAPGPERHMLLVRDYDYKTDQFITNDPGTKRGENYHYSSQVIMNSILVYPTGHHEATNEKLKGMLVVNK